MRPLLHPAIEDVSLEGLLYALSDPVRLGIVSELSNAGCAKNCSTFLTLRERKLSKSTLSQHFRILRDAGLIRSERQGIELKNSLRLTELRGRFGGLVDTILKHHDAQCGVTKRRK